ncbi:hypothetical protein Ahy_B03g062445 isoform A [Arachis hypogaea]|nr:hypothetical protein Ahy_B03g062445 isoform A [Arachis hypogaea]
MDKPLMFQTVGPLNDLPNLKRLDLSGSRKLIQIPDLSQSPNIEEIILSHCVKLDVVYSSSFLAKLSCLWLNGCYELRILNLPSSILLESLGVIVLCDCPSLEMFSVSKTSEGVLPFGCLRHGKLRCNEKKKEEEKQYENTEDNIHLLRFKVLREGSPSSFPGLEEICWLDLSNCESLTILPVELLQMKFLKRLDLCGCSSLESFPEINQTMENLTVLILDKTGIQELPSSLHHFVGLEELSFDLEFLPSNIVNLGLLSDLDCSGCVNLTKIPNNIDRLSSLRELSLQGSGIVNLPESIAHLSSLKSLDLSDCKMLECIPLLAFDCPSVRRVSSSSLKLPPDSKEGLFKFHFTNSQELDPSAHSNIAADACDMIIQDAYKSVLFCFPGSEVPQWFPYRCRGNSVTLDPGSLNPNNGDRLIGFALCVVLGSSEVQRNKNREFPYRLKFEYEGMHVLGNNDHLRNYFYWKDIRIFEVHHTLVWKYTLESSAITYMLSHARNFNFEICEESHGYGVPTSNVVECGICPLYTKEKDNNFPAGDYWTQFCGGIFCIHQYLLVQFSCMTTHDERGETFLYGKCYKELQLRLGFRKIDTDRWEFANDNFVKGQKHLLINIRRRKHPHAADHQKPDNSDEAAANDGLWKEVENLKSNKNSLMQELVKLRQHQESAENKLLLLTDRLQGMEKHQQQMLSFLVMVVQSPGFMVQLLQPNENNWRMAELGDGNGMIVKYKPPVPENLKPVVPRSPTFEKQPEPELSFDGLKDLCISSEFLKVLMDEKLSPLENHPPFLLPDLPDDGSWEQLFLGSPFLQNTDEADKPTVSGMEIEPITPEDQTEKSQSFESLILEMEKTEETDALELRADGVHLEGSEKLKSLTKQMELLASETDNEEEEEEEGRK